MNMSQAIAEISHFRKCLVISGNDQAIAGIPVLPRQLWELQAFPEMPRQLGEFNYFCLFKFNKFEIPGNSTAYKATKFKYFKLN